jgi:Family of unknown function (DUF6459)
MSTAPLIRTGRALVRPTTAGAPGSRALNTPPAPVQLALVPPDSPIPAPQRSTALERDTALEREVQAIARNTVQAAIEVLAGTRPVQQLARRLDHRCLSALQHRAALIRREAGTSPSPGRRLHRNAAVRSVRLCAVSPDVYEASAVVVDEVRARAVALRLERNEKVWRVTALEIG